MPNNTASFRLQLRQRFGDPLGGRADLGPLRAADTGAFGPGEQPVEAGPRSGQDVSVAFEGHCQDGACG